MRPRTILLSSVLLLLMIGIFGNEASAQTNLLANAGFEQPYGGGYQRNTAAGWTPWVGVGNADFYPEQFGSVHSGGNSQAMLAIGVVRDSSPLDVGVYQVVHNIPIGSRVRASAWVSVWMFNVPDPANAGALLQIGIDPNGGTNPYDSDVGWSGVNAAQGGAQGDGGWLLSYVPVSIEAITTGPSVTVYLRWRQTWGGNEQRAFFDDASLVILQPGSGSTTTTSPEPSAPAPVAPSGDYTTYVVVSGDTLYRIAARYGTTVAGIIATNSLVNPDIIHAGLALNIPGSGAVPAPSAPAPAAPVPAPTTTATGSCTSPYTVQSGDNLYRISLRCGTTVAAITFANGIGNQNLIFVGQQLIIP
jgi:LysM repeat protein